MIAYAAVIIVVILAIGAGVIITNPEIIDPIVDPDAEITEPEPEPDDDDDSIIDWITDSITEFIDPIITGYEIEPIKYRYFSADSSMNCPESQRIEGFWGQVVTFTYSDGTTSMITRVTGENIFGIYTPGKDIVSIRYNLYGKLTDDSHDTATLDLREFHTTFLTHHTISEPVFHKRTDMQCGRVIEIKNGDYKLLYTSTTNVDNIMFGSSDIELMIMNFGNPIMDSWVLDAPNNFYFSLNKDTNGMVTLEVDTDGDVYKLISEDPYE